MTFREWNVPQGGFWVTLRDPISYFGGNGMFQKIEKRKKKFAETRTQRKNTNRK